MGYGVAFRTYHNIVVRKKITPSIPGFTSTMVQEISAALTDQIGTPEGSPSYVDNTTYLSS